MRNLRRRLLPLLAMVLLVCSAMTVTALAAGEEAAAPGVYGTFWALLPPPGGNHPGTDYQAGLSVPVPGRDRGRPVRL